MHSMDEYKPPLLSTLLHKLPHVNVSLQRVNSTFAPHSSVYIESLGILGTIPGAWLILTLLVLLIYLLTRCCDRKPRPPKSISALKISLMILSILCCGAIGVGLFGNDDLHNAMLQTLQAGKQLATLVSTVKNQSEALESAMGARARVPLTRLADALDAPAANQTALGTLLRALAALRANASAAAGAARALHAPLRPVHLDRTLQTVWRYETVRWGGAMVGWCALGAVCVALLAAAARRSRRALLALAVAALAALVLCWLAAAALLALAVALADACQAPAAALADRAAHILSPDIVQYYLSCRVSRDNNLLTVQLRSGQRAVLAVRQALGILARGAPQLFNDPGLQPALGALSAGTGEAERALVALSGALDCRASRAAFAAGARAACDAGLLGLALMLLAALLAGLLFTAIVWIDSHAWIYIGGKREYSGADENAPFLPGGSSVGSSSGGGGGATATLPRGPAPHNQGSYYLNGKAHPPPPTYSAAVALAARPIDDDPAPDIALYTRGECGVRAAAVGGARGSHLGGGCHTLGRLPSHAPPPAGPNNGKYATLSKQCKTLESSDFY